MFKKKKIPAVFERTEDTKEFEIYQIGEFKKEYVKNKFVSPIFGTNVKDDVVIPTPHERKGDLDRQFDNFRTKPKLNKEEMKLKYGSEYPEFDMVSGSNLEEALEKQTRKSSSKPSSDSDQFQKYSQREKYANEKHEPIVNKPYVRDPEAEIPIFKKPKPRDTEIEQDLDDEIVPKTSIRDYVEKRNNEKKAKEALEVTDTNEGKSEVQPKKSAEVPKRPTPLKKDYVLPPFSLLSKPVRKVENNKEWIQKQIDILNRTFIEFGVGASVLKYTKGPTVTRYEIVLDSGVNVKKVTSISDNIKMALAAKEIRLEAPIPGKSTIGIEVPNEIAEIVHFCDIVNSPEFTENDSPLSVAIGLDIDGKGVFTSIAKMPHGLVAGATNSGKSVCVNTIIMSLLFKYSPDELKLMLIDPKMVELTAYNELPHLITPVITDPKIATAGLKWAVEEMDRRFLVFANDRVKDIKSYNARVERENLGPIMPYMVIIVDELADLMMVASSSVEEAIMRLTQKARACGIHLIIATQRPSTDVVKGTIKSNIPTRIAFSVASYIDSMTIIDGAGADKLLGRGDMLFCENGQVQRRVQGAYISDSDIGTVNDFIRSQREANYLFTKEKLVSSVAASNDQDELLPDIARFVVKDGTASINKISKEFRIGFNRAQKIVETLCSMGIVSDNEGSKARTALLSEIELEDMFSN